MSGETGLFIASLYRAQSGNNGGLFSLGVQGHVVSQWQEAGLGVTGLCCLRARGYSLAERAGAVLGGGGPQGKEPLSPPPGSRATALRRHVPRAPW